MKRFETWRLMPHEAVFVVFIVAALGRLLAAQGSLSPLSLLYASLLTVLMAGVIWCRRLESETRWRIRLALYPLAMNVAYFTLGDVIPLFHPDKADAILQSIDARLIGGNASLWLERFSHPVFTEILSICYLTFFPGLLLSWFHYFRCELPVLRSFIAGMFTVYGIGFLGYTLLPALGPYLDPVISSRFGGPLAGGGFTRLNAQLVLNGSNRVDAFPSLHCAVTMFTLLFDRIHSPKRFRWWLLPVTGLWFATVYLRYHYFVDVLAGFMLGAAAFWMVRQTSSSRPYELYPSF